MPPLPCVLLRGCGQLLLLLVLVGQGLVTCAVLPAASAQGAAAATWLLLLLLALWRAAVRRLATC
jgi:hypothetical protein